MVAESGSFAKPVGRKTSSLNVKKDVDRNPTKGEKRRKCLKNGILQNSLKDKIGI